ncbi:mitochondrial carrier [Nadsonia fulvescens var. elongata DSM 6958]|uniref:Mitochondrial carrier n=1 Tax=Nadsonia fulvescens var. elongata DSM 6958 TaxID=857566 RepID=A0A1E3PG71_9ASCO|nr:mitochondrial carrier [Nadsonia fulvescens var. elongata DSM 6958]
MEQITAFIAGGFGGVCAVVVGHPFDLIKVRLQTSNHYNSAFDCVKRTVAKDGVKGLYRGVMAPLAGVTPMFAVSFWGYDVGKQIVKSLRPAGTDANTPLTISEISAAGFISAFPTTAIAAPFERVKVMLQIQGQQAASTAAKNANPGAAAAACTVGAATATASANAAKPHFNGALDVVKYLYKTGGIKSIFKGSVATVARDGPGSALYFATYEYIKRELTKGDDSGKMSLGAISFAGGMAGLAMWIPVFPIDTIKSNLQMASGNTSISSITKAIYRKGGIKAFFPGIGPALARSFPANAATFVGVELATQFFKTYL